MAAACERQRVKLAIAFQSRYSPKLPAVRDLIQEGRLGNILELRGRGKEDARGGGEDLWVLGSHVLNLMGHFGGEPRWCFATVQQNGHAITRSDVQDGPEGIGPLAGDTIQAVYGMDDGVTGYFGSHRNATDKTGNRFGLQIFGSLGVVEILTGYLPAVHFLDDPSWSPGRSGKNWVPVSSAGLGQPEPLQDGGLRGGQRRGLHRLAPGDRTRPTTRSQHLRSATDGRHDLGSLRVAAHGRSRVVSTPDAREPAHALVAPASRL